MPDSRASPLVVQLVEDARSILDFEAKKHKGPPPPEIAIWITTDFESYEVQLPPGDVLLIGRDPGCDIQFPDAERMVSRVHAMLAVAPRTGALLVIDPCSTNFVVAGDQATTPDQRMLVVRDEFFLLRLGDRYCFVQRPFPI